MEMLLPLAHYCAAHKAQLRVVVLFLTEGREGMCPPYAGTRRPPPAYLLAAGGTRGRHALPSTPLSSPSLAALSPDLFPLLCSLFLSAEWSSSTPLAVAVAIEPPSPS